MSLQSLITRCLGPRDAVAIARGQAARWQTWLQPISEASPVGEDPGYDDDFQRMREEVDKLSGADAEQVAQLAEKLLTRTCKDLRVATYYVWARLHGDGEAGLADGLGLLAALVERFADSVLPVRPNSRKVALQWLAGGKVLDTLSLYPEVVKAEAERTAAALAWLERGLDAWPEDQRPCLAALHAALSARLAQSGGVEAVVPQNAASQESSALAGASTVPAIKSGRDLLDHGRALAGYLRDQPQGWLAAHRLMKSLRWDTVHQAPPQDAAGKTRLMPPRPDYRAQLKRLYLQQGWSQLLDQVERIYAEGVNHFWLDLQWYVYQALRQQPAPQSDWADVTQRDLGMFLDRLPGLELLCWNDGTPFADETTREWIAQHASGNRAGQWSPAPASAPGIGDADMLSWEGEALAQADREGVEQALAWLAARPDIQGGRQRWLLRLLMARVAEQFGRTDLAIHSLEALDAAAQHHDLRGWEPDLYFEVKARLLKLLRLKAQRNDTDKPALARRMETLLAALVAIDPVRAAVLCG
ncbi:MULTISPECIES: type VI secretion system protein TssA [Pseudomonas]|jgi:type VI secretion system protein VasJ|uniref:Type VI secretion protein n=1 Tax=Pseudomonas frederiksbergensis TaxID=104087 RepID=A0A0B1ZA52_9PSED|nr:MULTISPECIES: type VI secretion system protein TssA [Pseudomonas]KHK66252.1 type VI secretion protein [Pseudomonas frederiksbergensis]KJH85540.1 type VI secretion protein [Pseudomonas fluorescens]WRV70771.1 type VI secretion system protein TssA [Pseudomonas frederiksbergensis]